MSIDNITGREKQLSKINRYSNAANRLNRDANKWQVEHPTKDYNFSFPCPRSKVFINALFTHGHLENSAYLVEKEALAIPCDCHPNLTLDQLLDMEFNEVK